MKITTLKKAEKAELKDIQALMTELSSDPSKHTPVKLAVIKALLKDKRSTVVIAVDGKRIVGMGNLGTFRTLRGVTGYIDDVVVLSEYRGKGLGEKISREIMAIAKKKKLYRLDLTSRPYRAAANKLYQKLGFELRETNAYTIKP